MRPSLSVIIPALNEEDNIEECVGEVLAAVGERFSDYEILIFDDGSTDATGGIADDLASRDKHIRVIHNGRTMGFGYNYRTGVERAKKDYVVMFPGDNEIPSRSMKKVLDLAGTADIIIPYTVNTRVRPPARRIVSSLFTITLNLLFGLRLRYYNGTVVHKSALIKSVPMTTDSFAYQAEILVKLIKAGRGYVQTGMYLRDREHGSSKAFRIKNIIDVFKTIGRLFVKVRLT